MTDGPTRTYTSEPLLRRPRRLLAEMAADLAASRELAWRLMLRDIRAQYRQSLLGLAWAVLPPVATALVFVLLHRQRVIQVADTAVAYPAFALLGTVLWQVFVDSLNAPLRTVSAARGLLSKINFPREALVLSGIGQTLFGLSVKLAILAAVFAVYDLPLRWTLLLSLLAVGALILVGTAIGLLITPVGLLYSDVSQALPVVTGLWFFVTPVVYPPPDTPLFSWLVALNPAAAPLVAARDWATRGVLADPLPLVTVTAAAFLLLLASWVVYRLAFPIVVERMPS